MELFSNELNEKMKQGRLLFIKSDSEEAIDIKKLNRMMNSNNISVRGETWKSTIYEIADCTYEVKRLKNILDANFEDDRNKHYPLDSYGYKDGISDAIHQIIVGHLNVVDEGEIDSRLEFERLKRENEILKAKLKEFQEGGEEVDYTDPENGILYPGNSFGRNKLKHR